MAWRRASPAATAVSVRSVQGPSAIRNHAACETRFRFVVGEAPFGSDEQPPHRLGAQVRGPSTVATQRFPGERADRCWRSFEQLREREGPGDLRRERAPALPLRGADHPLDAGVRRQRGRAVSTSHEHDARRTELASRGDGREQRGGIGHPEPELEGMDIGHRDDGAETHDTRALVDTLDDGAAHRTATVEHVELAADAHATNSRDVVALVGRERRTLQLVEALIDVEDANRHDDCRRSIAHHMPIARGGSCTSKPLSR